MSTLNCQASIPKSVSSSKIFMSSKRHQVWSVYRKELYVYRLSPLRRHNDVQLSWWVEACVLQWSQPQGHEWQAIRLLQLDLIGMTQKASSSDFKRIPRCNGADVLNFIPDPQDSSHASRKLKFPYAKWSTNVRCTSWRGHSADPWLDHPNYVSRLNF